MYTCGFHNICCSHRCSADARLSRSLVFSFSYFLLDMFFLKNDPTWQILRVYLFVLRSPSQLLCELFTFIY